MKILPVITKEPSVIKGFFNFVRDLAKSKPDPVAALYPDATQATKQSSATNEGKDFLANARAAEGKNLPDGYESDFI